MTKHYIEKEITKKERILDQVTCTRCGKPLLKNGPYYRVTMTQYPTFPDGYEVLNAELCGPCSHELEKSFMMGRMEDIG